MRTFNLVLGEGGQNLVNIIKKIYEKEIREGVRYEYISNININEDSGKEINDGIDKLIREGILERKEKNKYKITKEYYKNMKEY